MNSRKEKEKALKNYTLKDIAPRGFNIRIVEVQEKHQRAIEDQQRAVTDCYKQIQAIQYKNVALQPQRDVYQAHLQRCQDQIHDLITNYNVSYANDPGSDNIILIIEKKNHL